MTGGKRSCSWTLRSAKETKNGSKVQKNDDGSEPPYFHWSKFSSLPKTEKGMEELKTEKNPLKMVASS